MSERTFRVCDFCGTRAATETMGGHNLRGLEVTLKIHRSMWGSELEWPISFKGELCPVCVRKLRRALVRAYEEVVSAAKERHATAAARGAAIIKRFT